MTPIGNNPFTGYSMMMNMGFGTGAGGAIQTPGTRTDTANIGKVTLNPGESTRVAPGKKSSPAECQTCKERKYQDGSNESNVSFQTAQHVSPGAAASAVRAHEGQHVSNAYKKAAEDGGKVLQASVAIHTSICPECGRTYVSGGTTTTKIRYSNEENPYVKNMKNRDNGLLSGMIFNAAI